MAEVIPGSDEPLDASRLEEERSAEELLQEAEPWETWETQLVSWSIGIGILGLIVLGWLVNKFLLQ